MLRRSAKLLLVICLAVCLGSVIPFTLADHTPAQASPDADPVGEQPDLPDVDPDALRMLQSHAPEIPIILVLHSTLPSAAPFPEALSSGRLQVRQDLVANLQLDFQNSLPGLTSVLDEAQRKGDLLDRRDLWLVNGMALTVRPDLFRLLAASPAVKRMDLDHYRAFLAPGDVIAAPLTATTRSDAGDAWGIEKIRAAEAWHTFGVSGTGAVVAIMDTGVDFLHPALNTNYRGHLGKGLYVHPAAWFDAVNGGVYPYDDQGHGSHVAGTAVGEGNIGVAPGAQWIGVKVLDTYGYGYDSWILGGFQWLLAPGGDAALAPDVVNASWSSSNARNTVFEQAVNTLTEAGVWVVFAAGNEGPASPSVGAPASYKGVFAVGASDQEDDVAAFSGRGPSPWQEIKPYVVAPGVNIPSSIPGGVYASYQGTSMAAPHVAGLAALLRGISPTLSASRMANIITSTAVPLSVTTPNNESGWGRIDAFEAVASLVNPAIVTGFVRKVNGQGIGGAVVMARSMTEPGLQAQTTTDGDGRYTLACSPGFVDIEASAFGFYAQTKWGVEVTAGTPVQGDFILPPLPTGAIHGRVFISGTGQTVTESVTVKLDGTPLAARTSLSGNYELIAPQGTYTLSIHEVGYRAAAVSVTVRAHETLVQDMVLSPAARLLIVDEGAWYYGSQRIYWTAALDALGYVYDVLAVKLPHTDTPTESTLLDYDIVLWSSPRGAPGLVGGAEPLAKYLEAGGRLFISGQDVAYYDSGGLWDMGPQAYMQDLMGVSYAGERNIVDVVQGLGPYAGLELAIQGQGGADNQVAPDVVQIVNPDVAALPWQYADGTGAGSAVDLCTPYRALFFSFGFEAIEGASQRQDVMRRSLDWLTTAPLTTGLTIKRISDPVLIGVPGNRMTHTLRVRHTGISGTPEVVTLHAEGGLWPVEMTPPSTVLSPCATLTVTVVVTIPQDAGIHATDWLTLTALSRPGQSSAKTWLKSKTPAPVLLVDDDRWYPVEDRYKAALEAAGLFYDIWDNRDYLGGIPGMRSPLTETMDLYPVLVWFTGYDWYAPIIAIESDRLLDYLDRGGRLILSSQDFLYQHESDTLAKRLGVQAVSDGETILVVQGTGHPASVGRHTVHLDYPFPVHTDIVEPIPGAEIVFRGLQGQPVGIAASLKATGLPATLFYGFPLEALPEPNRADALSGGVGWLSPLGRSAWQVSPGTAVPGDRLTYTLVLRNDDGAPAAVTAAHLIPEGQMLELPSLPPDLAYDAPARTVAWDGQLMAGEVLTYVWQTRVLSDITAPAYPTVTLSMADWGLKFDRFARFFGRGPELATSAWVSPAYSDLHTGSAVTLSFLLRNRADDASPIHASVWMMEGFSPLTATAPITDMPHGWYSPLWEGNLASTTPHTLEVPLRAWLWEGPVRVDARLRDAFGNRWEIPLWLNVSPWRFYLPRIIKTR